MFLFEEHLRERPDPLPVSREQLGALFASALRELLWGLGAVSRETHFWRLRASAIPDRLIRTQALASLADKRQHLDGAALFSILPQRRNPHLLRLLVAYEVALEFLDAITEPAVTTCEAHRAHLHRALAEALDPGAPVSDYYRFSPRRADAGYLRTLVHTCRRSCARLPSYQRVRGPVIVEANRAQVLALNHEPDPRRRDSELRAWVKREFPYAGESRWFELSGAATASLSVHVLLALAAEPELGEDDVDSVRSAYFPRCALLSTMLDSYVDQFDDAANSEHSYLGHYGSCDVAVQRLVEVIDRAARGARALPNGCRHAVIIASMIAMYLSADAARTPELRPCTRTLADAGGSLTRMLLPVLRAWRIAYGLRSA
jgi:tetraprenyl-beta-curcumene synthase